MVFIRRSPIILFSFISLACASSPMIQPQINSLVVAQKFDHALKILEENKEGYGEKNKLLYLLDYGFLLHGAGKYQESIHAFEQAKQLHQNLYTVSVSNELTTWLVNDNTAPFRPEDYELVFINIIQALNYAVLNDFEEALVEARQVDSLLSLINSRFSVDQKNVYKEDAFARLLMGIMYESNHTLEYNDDAYLEYKRALKIYEQDYRAHYGMQPPIILRQKLLALSEKLDKESYQKYKERWAGSEAISNAETAKPTVYLVQYEGFVPIKHESSIPIPLPNGLLARLSFPSFDKRFYQPLEGVLQAENVTDKTLFQQKTELVENIVGIAKQNLENRRVRVIAKSALRTGVKYALEQTYSQHLEARHGESASGLFKYLSSLYNLTSEQADLRSWQTLPAEIRLARLVLEPGKYHIMFNKRRLDDVILQNGDVKFYVVRSSK